MLITSDVVLFRTFLSDDYSNVFDFSERLNNYRSAYLDFLERNYDFILAQLESNEISRKDSNSEFSIIVKKSSLDIHDYNYVAFTSKDMRGDVLVFAFVTSITSVNDGVISKSSVLHCKYDSWINNYESFKNSKNIFTPTRSTIDDVSTPFAPNGEEFKLRTRKEYSKGFFNEVNINYEVIWQVCKCNHAISQQGTSFDRQFTLTPFATSTPDDGLVTLYRPVGVIDTNTRRLVYCKKIETKGPRQYQNQITYQFYTNYETLITDEIIARNVGKIQGYLSLASANGTYVVENFLTYNVPFPYRLNMTYFSSNNTFNATIDVWGYGFVAGDMVVSGTTTRIVNDYTFNPTDFIAPYTLDVEPYNGWERILDVAESPVYHHLGVSREAIAESQAKFFEYPFHYDSLVINGEENQLIPPTNSDGRYRIRYFPLSNQSSIQILNSRNDFIEYKKCNTSKQIKIITEALSDYLARNANKMQAEYYTTIVKGVGNMITSGFKGAVSGLSNPLGAALGAGLNVMNSMVDTGVGLINTSISQEATKNDLRNFPNSVSIDSDSALEDVRILDDIFIIKHRTNINDDDVWAVLFSIHSNGYKNALPIDIFSIRREIFDFVQGTFSLKADINIEDRKDIEAALNRGIRFWHINRDDQGREVYISKFDLYVSNPVIQ